LPPLRISDTVTAVNTPRHEFWRQYPGIIWSNPDADDGAYIRAALLRPRFGRLLHIAAEFGLERVRTEWETLCTEGTLQMARARPSVERILQNVEKGFALAAARH
jgi:hypothetical protein